MLPDYLADALSLVGIPWPNIDEDELRHSASDLNEFASSLTESVKDTSGVVSDTAGQTDAAFARTFAAQWEGRPREIAVISEGCHVLAGALGVIAGAVEVAKNAVIATLGALAGALTAELFFTGGLGDLQLEMAATRLETHAHRTETTGETLRRRGSGRDFAHGGSTIGAMVKQALETVLKDLAEQIPKVVAQVQRDMSLFLKKAAKDLAEADEKLASDAQGLAGVGREHPEPSFGGRGGGEAGTPGEDIRGSNPGRAAARPRGKRPCKGDPVDVATGWVVLAQTDVELAGVLPLVLSRAHISSYVGPLRLAAGPHRPPRAHHRLRLRRHWSYRLHKGRS